MDEDDDKPFLCSSHGCGQRFTNEDHLAVHMHKHEMSLALNLGNPFLTGSGKSPLSALPGLNFVDQTPTPTKFLKNCEEIGLFQELKNPFEEAFKKALDAPESNTDAVSSPFPGPGSNELNTPVPPIPKTVDDIQSSVGKQINDATKTDLQMLVTRRKRKESSLITSSSEPDTKSPNVAFTPTKLDDDDIKSVQSSLPTTKTSTLVTAAQSTTLSPPKTTLSSLAFPQPTLLQQPVPIQNQSGTAQIAMQVLVQLPTGQTLPVQIPAALPPQVVQVVPSTVGKTVASAVPQFISAGGLVTNLQPVVTHIQPLVTGVHTITSPPGQQSALSASLVNKVSQNALTKQKLKLALQSQTLPSPKQGLDLARMSYDQKVPTSLALPTDGLTTLAGGATLTTSLSSLPGIAQSAVTSPLSVDMSYTSDTASSPDPADSTVTIKRVKVEDDDSDGRRKKFLERNRAAAARCRQKRKHWISNLEKKGEELQSANSRLQSEVNMLRTEVAQLKTLLIAHKDCPVTLQQRQQGQIPLSLSVIDSESETSQSHNQNEVSSITKTTTSKGPEVVTISLANLVSGNNLLPGVTVLNRTIPATNVIQSKHPSVTIIPKIIKTEQAVPRK